MIPWRVYHMTGGSGGKAAFSLIGSFKTKREAVKLLPMGARNIVRVKRDYWFIPVK